MICISFSVVYEVLRNKTRQSIIGFGGAFTDSAGINIASLPQAAQDKLLQSYFAPEGIEYNIGRVPMASCDFSTHQYSYDDVDGDFQLQHFALAPEDLKYKVNVSSSRPALFHFTTVVTVKSRN